jgi:hypothetical protein
MNALPQLAAANVHCGVLPDFAEYIHRRKATDGALTRGECREGITVRRGSKRLKGGRGL